MQEIDCDPQQMLGDKVYDSKSVRDATRWQGRHPQLRDPNDRE